MQNTLTPQQIQAFNHATGWNVNATPAPAANLSRADQIRALGKSAAPKPAPAPTAPETPSLGTRIGADIQNAGDQAYNAVTDTSKNPIEAGIQATGAAFGAVPKVASEFLPTPAREAIGAVGNATGGIINWLGDKIGSTQAAQDFVTKFPDAANHLQELAKTGEAAGNISNTILGAAGAAEGANRVVHTASDVANTVKGATEVANTLAPTPTESVNFVKQNVTGAPSPEVSTIQDMISPKMTPKEVKLALDQGRIVPGQDPTLLRGGTPDRVLPTAATVRAAQTIFEQIPGAHEMKAPDLYNALDKKIGSLATDLKPNMEAVPVSDTVVQKITDAWDKLKTQQSEDPYMSSSANLEKLQTQFEKKFIDPIINQGFSEKMSESLGVPAQGANMNDLWERAKAYDDSVPANVKNANSLSSDVLQAQKSIWLQNRAILRNAINDAATGLGETSKKAFAQMSDMYNAQKGIQSSFKLTKEGAPSRIVQLAEKHPYLTGAAATGAATLTGIPQKVIGAVTGL